MLPFYTAIPFFRNLRKEHGQRAMCRLFAVALSKETVSEPEASQDTNTVGEGLESAVDCCRFA